MLAKHNDSPPFADHKDLHKVINTTELGDVPWQCLSVQYVGERSEDNVPPWMDNEYEVWYRDPRLMVHNMLANPTYKGEIDYALFREYDTSDNTCRWKDFMSGDWAWQQADDISNDHNTHGSMFIPIILGSDKTTVSVGTGNNEYYPLYASIGNVHNNVQRAHRDALVVIGFLSIPKTNRKYTHDDTFRTFRRQLFHRSLSLILASLKPAMTDYEVVRCPDGHFRHVIYGLGPYIADYEEQLVLSCTVKNWCPKCLAIRTNLDGGGMHRCREHTDLMIHENVHSDTLWHEYGNISVVVPFTNDFPWADIYQLLSFDLLHQLIKGAFKDHLVDWVIMSDVDRSIVPGLRRFPEGRDFKQWTGDNSKSLMKVFLPAIKGHVPRDMVRAFRALLEFCYLVWHNVVTECTMLQIQDALVRFHRYRQIFETTGTVSHFSLPRQHSMCHYADMIRLFGAPNGLCSSITESKHIKAVKNPWRWSSKNNALGQMLLTNQRLDKLAASHVDFATRGMLVGSGKLYIFNSAAATFYAPSDPSGIRVCPLWRNVYARNDCVFINTNPGAEGMQGLEVARIKSFFSFKHDWELYPCTLVHWFDKVGDCTDEDTGMWIVCPSVHDDDSPNLTVIHIDTVYRAAHLIPVYGSDFIPNSLKYYHSYDAFRLFYVNKYADHHAFEIAS
ncbi:uncharacterized protein EDB91DRAFT_1239616 [Suillus paluster]|uniref:uncharacterized protein n=1 Tax=Suillus paluster TaxID=48578 RepID=UPI001B882D97|nr:uncharacterized protein EDB91DRAFT_1239616 [Suillus paluster]KAG1726712.1 hypothetical protein EDB91DRAFT_1239616 [Suillus paluster]